MKMQGTYDELYRSLLEIVSFFIRPKQDKLLLQKAGVALDIALFPLMMQIAHHGALGIVELASEVDRDHSTVSRQVDKLVARGLATPTNEVTDRRARKVRLTDAGAGIAYKIATARRAMMRKALKDWNEEQLASLQDSVRHLAETIRDYTITVEYRSKRKSA